MPPPVMVRPPEEDRPAASRPPAKVLVPANEESNLPERFRPAPLMRVVMLMFGMEEVEVEETVNLPPRRVSPVETVKPSLDSSPPAVMPPVKEVVAEPVMERASAETVPVAMMEEVLILEET